MRRQLIDLRSRNLCTFSRTSGLARLKTPTPKETLTRRSSSPYAVNPNRDASGSRSTLQTLQKGESIKTCQVTNANDVTPNGCVLLRGVQVALFKLVSGTKTQGYAVQNLYPHDRRQVLSCGHTGDVQGEPKVACPLHKNAFSLCTGDHLGGGAKLERTLTTFPVQEGEGLILVEFATEHVPIPTGVAHEYTQKPN